MKTKVMVKSDIHQESARKGQVGYIDGYVQAADQRPYVVVVIGKEISLVPHVLLEVID